jgi:hypothetical protein
VKSKGDGASAGRRETSRAPRWCSPLTRGWRESSSLEARDSFLLDAAGDLFLLDAAGDCFFFSTATNAMHGGSCTLP